MAEGEARTELHRFREMLEGVLGATPSRMTQPDHQVAPGLLIIELTACVPAASALLRELADRPARVQIEHGHVGPPQQGVRVGIVGVERDRLLQQLLARPCSCVVMRHMCGTPA